MTLFLHSTTIRFKPLTEHERLKDVLTRKELHENASFDRDNMTSKTVHRHEDKRKWISTDRGGFTIAPKLRIPET